MIWLGKSIREQARGLAKSTKFFDPKLLSRTTIHNGHSEVGPGKHPITPESYNSHVNSGSYSFLTAWNPHSKALPHDVNIARNAALEYDLHKLGATFHDVVGHYGGNPEASFMVHHSAKVTPRHLEDLARKYEQTSLVHSVNDVHKLLHVTGEHMGKHEIMKGHEQKPGAKDNFTAPISAPDTKMSIPFTFKDENLKKSKVAPHTVTIRCPHEDGTESVTELHFDGVLHDEPLE